MKIEVINVGSPEANGGSGEGGSLSYLLNLPEKEYDSRAAALFASASAWSYSDLRTFGTMLCRRGLVGQCVAVSLTNEALLVDTTAYIFQSEDKRLVIVCARGTQPTNLINWLTDATAKQDPFAAAGHVHGGFFRAGLVLWPVIKDLLLGASYGLTLKEMLADLSARDASCAPIVPPPELAGKDVEKDSPLQAVYFCGHSAGGALAVLAAGGVYMDMSANLGRIRPLVRAIYTYGQPMVGDRTLAATLQEKFGDKLFRHVYGRDVVPRLPPRTAGRFEHFGREYTLQNGVWVRGERPLSQAFTITLSMTIGVLAWVKEQLPLLRWLRLPFSWDHHSPVFYMRTSEAFQPGHEVM